MNSAQSWPHMIVGVCSCPMVHSGARRWDESVRGARQNGCQGGSEMWPRAESNLPLAAEMSWSSSIFILAVSALEGYSGHELLYFKIPSNLPAHNCFKDDHSFKGIVNPKVKFLSFVLLFYPHFCNAKRVQWPGAPKRTKNNNND